MKITAFETRAVGLPRAIGPTTPGAATFVTLKLHTDNGLEGIGYAGFGTSVMLPALKAAVDGLAALTVGRDPIDVEAIRESLLTAGGSGSPAGIVTRAVAGIDVALWDLKAKAAGLPLHKLLGGFRDRVPAYASGELWRNYDLRMLAETAPKLVEQGFKAMKFRLGAEPTAAKELERVRVMREAVGPDVTLMIDINQAWSVNQAMTIGKGLAEHDIYWLEDPTHYQDYAGLARIAHALETPIAAGEYHYGIAPFRHMLEARSIDVVMVDLMRAGGITGWMKVAHMAEAFNLPVVTHLAPEVLMHALAAVPNGTWAEYMPWSLPLFTELPKLEDGQLVLPQTPGLGLDFDDAVLAKYAL